MSLHPSSKSTRALTSMSVVILITLATQAVSFFPCNEKANTEWEVTAIKLNGQAAGIVMDRLMLTRLPSLRQGLKGDHIGFEICFLCTPSSYLSSWDSKVVYPRKNG